MKTKPLLKLAEEASELAHICTKQALHPNKDYSTRIKGEIKDVKKAIKKLEKELNIVELIEKSQETSDYKRLKYDCNKCKRNGIQFTTVEHYIDCDGDGRALPTTGLPLPNNLT